MYQPKEAVKVINNRTGFVQELSLYPHLIPVEGDEMFIMTGPEQGQWCTVEVVKRTLDCDNMENPVWKIFVK